MPYMQSIVEALEKKASLKGQVKTIFGDCIATQEYADSIRADGYAPNVALPWVRRKSFWN